ncbi:response regulator transcription factor [Streptomyces sp. NPDC047017]|uniref:response regulator transcription factor n=1 Tax=Streptomyces sp. NPDC047017 TaxID=3155024 RepID=UPI0033D4F425
MCAHVMVAEDDEKQARLARVYLESEGHDVVVVRDGRDALEYIRRSTPDLVVLDVMMPRVDGLDVVRILRSSDGELAGLPVLMLTARATEDDLLLGLDLGADDYLTKPYSPRELVARVRTLLRRTAPRHAPGSSPVLSVGAVTVDPVRHLVTVEGRPVECTPGEFRLLAMLAEQPERVFSRGQLLQELHGVDRFVSSRTVDAHVMNLRRKIETSAGRPSRLVTVYGVGYKLTAGPDRG